MEFVLEAKKRGKMIGILQTCCAPEQNLPRQGAFVTFPSQPVALTQGCYLIIPEESEAQLRAAMKAHQVF